MLENNSENFEKIIETLQVGIVLSDLNGNIKFFNSQTINILEKEKEIIEKSVVFELLKIDKKKEELEIILSAEIGEMFFIKTEIGEEKNLKKLKIQIHILEEKTKKILLFKIAEIFDSSQDYDFLYNREAIFKNLVENSPSGILIRNETQFLYANEKALKILGFSDLEHLQNFEEEKLYAKDVSEILKERLSRAKKGEVLDYLQIKIRRPIDGKIIEIESIPAVINYQGEEVYQIVVNDIFLKKQLIETKLRADLAEENYLKLKKEIIQRQKYQQELSQAIVEKDILIKEVHHRVKNNLQIISSILNLEMRTISEDISKQALLRVQNRVKSIYLVHEIVYQSGMFSRVNLSLYIKMLCDNFVRNNGIYSFMFSYEMEEINLTLDIAVPCGMIMNEVLYNFVDTKNINEKNNKLNVFLKEQDQSIELKFSYPLIEQQKIDKIFNKTSLSTQLTEALSDQIGGEYEILTDKDNNINFILIFEK